MSQTVTILLLCSYSMTSLIMYSRNIWYVKNEDLWIGAISIPALIIFYVFSLELDPLNIGLLTAPLIIGILHHIMNEWSHKRFGRNFFLHLKHSKDLNGWGLRKDNQHFKPHDYLFSAILIILWIGWPFLSVITLTPS